MLDKRKFLITLGAIASVLLVIFAIAEQVALGREIRITTADDLVRAAAGLALTAGPDAGIAPQPGDALVIMPGTYDLGANTVRVQLENLKLISLSGPGQTLIRGSSTIFEISANGVSIGSQGPGITIMNGRIGIKVLGNVENVQIELNCIVNNTEFGVDASQLSSGELVEAKNNWWGLPSGPFHSSNPRGEGNAVTDKVRFEPWLIEPIEGCPSSSPQPGGEPYFEIITLAAPSFAQVGDNIQISAEVKNTGSGAGTQQVVFLIKDISGAVIYSKLMAITLPPLGGERLSFTHVFSAPGTYIIEVSTQDDTGSLSVEVIGQQTDVSLTGTVLNIDALFGGTTYWVHSEQGYLEGSDVDVHAIVIYCPGGDADVDPDIRVGDRVEVYGYTSGSTSGVIVDCAPYYIKKKEGKPDLIEQASGWVMTSEGVGIPRVTITFSRVSGTGTVPGPVTTEIQGKWSQAGFQAGTMYRATPSKTGYIFTPAHRDFSRASAELNFTGKPAIEIVSYDASPRQIQLGQEVTFSMRVRNVGSTSVTFYCWVYLKQHPTGNPTFALDPQILTLSGGQERTVFWQEKTEGTALGYGGIWDVKFSVEIRVEKTLEEYELASTGWLPGYITVNTLTPRVSASPSSGPIGTKFSVQWEGFTPNNTLTSHLQKPDGTEFPTRKFNTDSQGKASHTIDSTGFSPGTYTLWAVDDATGTKTINTATFTITKGAQLTPKVTVSPSSGSAGTQFDVLWEGFTPNNSLTSHLKKPDGTEFPTKTFYTDGQGRATHTIDSTGFKPGAYELWAVDNATGTRTVNTAFFTITAPKEKYPPRVKISLSPWPPIITVGQALTIDASGSYDPDGHIVSYLFDFGDSTNSGWVSNGTITHSYSDRGSYHIKVRIKDDDGLEGETEETIVVSEEVLFTGVIERRHKGKFLVVKVDKVKEGPSTCGQVGVARLKGEDLVDPDPNIAVGDKVEVKGIYLPFGGEATNDPQCGTILMKPEPHHYIKKIGAKSLQKELKVLANWPYPYPLAKLTVNYEWIDKRDGEDIYNISIIEIELVAFSGKYRAFIRDQQGHIIWEDSKWVSPKHKIYSFTFEGAPLIVRGPDEIGISLEGIDVVISIMKSFLHLVDKALEKLSELGLPLELIYKLTRPEDIEFWEKASIIVSKSSIVQFYPESEPSSAAVSLPDIHVAYLASPAELRVYDSKGRITGLVNGKVKEEIPNSAYFDNTVMILSAGDSYRYEVAGIKDGSYWLVVASVTEENSNTFSAVDIPTSGNVIHRYTVNWEALAQGAKGVTIEIDQDGDGVFEHTIQAGSRLRGEDINTVLPRGVLKIEQAIARLIPGEPSGAPEPDLVIGDREVLQAISFWISGEPVPGTGGQTIDDDKILELIQLWISGQPISSASARSEARQIGAIEGLMLREVKLYPNPMRSSSIATFKAEGTGIEGLKVEIFNLAGAKVFEEETSGNILKFQGLDHKGRPLANGVYLYVVRVRGFDGREYMSEVRKLVIVR